MSDLISRQAAIEVVKDAIIYDEWEYAEKALRTLPSAQSDTEAKILAAGYTGKEVRIYIGGRLFGVRELAQ